ncbi:hypothetical protein [Novosphingobium sp. Chol11]|uniref:hypothetical protein n=1 Tax=Novosphingobium sp. Chol11 TaxID=1385763 RepID=UPI0025FB77E5|nr:hypothetical protein [Novosphingobium sp. Chol11]
MAASNALWGCQALAGAGNGCCNVLAVCCTVFTVKFMKLNDKMARRQVRPKIGININNALKSLDGLDQH